MKAHRVRSWLEQIAEYAVMLAVILVLVVPVLFDWLVLNASIVLRKRPAQFSEA